MNCHSLLHCGLSKNKALNKEVNKAVRTKGRSRPCPVRPTSHTVMVVSTSNSFHAPLHYHEVIMGMMASQITSLPIVYSTVYLGADQTKYQRSASLALVRGIHRWPIYSPHKGPVTRKMLPFDDVIMSLWNGHSSTGVWNRLISAWKNVDQTVDMTVIWGAMMIMRHH